MKYAFIKEFGLSHAKLAKLFGYKNVNSFRCSTKHKTIMKAIESILTLINGYHIVELKGVDINAESKVYEQNQTQSKIL